MFNHSHISRMLIDVDITTSGKNSRKQQGVESCPFDSCQRICIHACLTTSNVSTMLIDIGITTSNRNSRKQQGVGVLPT
jgi:hypothetical protein